MTDRFHNFIRILRVQADRNGINLRKLLKQHGLSFHDGHGSERPDIAQTEPPNRQKLPPTVFFLIVKSNAFVGSS